MPKKKLKGKVVSDKNEKTIVVLVERKYQHPFLKKIIKSKKKYHVHDEKNTFKIGDIVQIEESRPYSKNKRFKVLEDNRWSKSKQNYLSLITLGQKR